jgi:hypothetical protein
MAKKKSKKTVKKGTKDLHLVEQMRMDDEDLLLEHFTGRTILMREHGMSGAEVAQALNVPVAFVYSTTAKVNAFVTSEEEASIIEQAKAAGLTNSEYILYLHQTYGKKVVKEFTNVA